MDRRSLSSAAYMASGRRVTRSQLKMVRNVFPFLDLPAELRNMVYMVAFGFESVTNYFDHYYDKIMTETDSRKRNPAPHKKVPHIFQLSRQIFYEASFLLAKKEIVLHHGLFKISRLSKVINPHILRSVGSLEISDGGHRLTKSAILPESWNGYMRLLKQVGETLAEGHSLKKLTICFSDPRLVEHMNQCWEADYDCGFRDGMRNAMNALRTIRGVKEVIIIGINPGLTEVLTKHIKSPKASFQNLPRELKNMIYKDCIDYSDISKSLIRAVANWPDKTKPFPYPKRTTPTVLLLNKQTTKEALELLHKKPLAITFPANHSIFQEPKIPYITRFISPPALQQIKTINIVMESWEWIFNFSSPLIDILAGSSQLETLHFTFKDSLKGSFLTFTNQHYPDNKLHTQLQKLSKIRSLKEVCFYGDLPLCYTGPLLSIMTSVPTVNEQLPGLRGVKKDGQITELAAEEVEEQAER